MSRHLKANTSVYLTVSTGVTGCVIIREIGYREVVGTDASSTVVILDNDMVLVLLMLLFLVVLFLVMIASDAVATAILVGITRKQHHPTFAESRYI